MDDELNKEFRHEMREALKELRKDVKQLLEFKWQIIGGSVAVSAIVSLAITLFLKK